MSSGIGRSRRLACIGRPVFAALVAIAALASASLARQSVVRQDESTPSAQIDQAQLGRLADELRPAIEDLRGARFQRPVRVELADREHLLGYIDARLALGSTPEERAADELVRKVLGLIPPQLDAERVQLALLEQQVAGYYDPGQDAFFLMRGHSGGVARLILAHELVHALDDQLHDIDAIKLRLPREADAQLACHAVVEGSATAVMNQWLARNFGSLRSEDVETLNELSTASLEGVPEALWLPLVATYFAGASFLARSEQLVAGQARAPKTEDLERAFREPPRSTEQLLHPRKYWDDAQRDEPRALKLDASKLTNAWTLVREDVIGELEWALVLRSPDERASFEPARLIDLLRSVQSNPASNGWAGTRAALFAQGESLALCVRSVWDSEADATEFDAALRARLPELAAAAQSLATLRGLSPMLSGVEFGAGAGADERELWCWVGVEAKQLNALRASLNWSVAPRSAVAMPAATGNRGS